MSWGDALSVALEADVEATKHPVGPLGGALVVDKAGWVVCAVVVSRTRCFLLREQYHGHAAAVNSYVAHEAHQERLPGESVESAKAVPYRVARLPGWIPSTVCHFECS